ncbi:MAG: EAL domain-containing protein [Magnetococcales bacterium]|nr:EAL domain-containing protein [Magnetococcales bacterium]
MSRKPLILVVDDDAVSRLMVCRFLERQHYDVIDATDGREALDHFNRAKPDMVLLDAKMPVMDGFEACQAMKAMPHGEHVPILMITGLNDEKSVDLAYGAGAVDFITKPIHWAILRNRVKHLLRVIDAERRLYLSDTVFRNTTEGIVVTDGQAIIQSVNPAFTQITNYTPEEAIGQPMSMLKSGRHDASFYKEMWEILLETGHWQGEIWNRRKSGEVYPEWAKLSAVYAPNSSAITSYIAVFSDLTSIKASEETLLYMTGHDALTDLPNRPMFLERLGQILAEARRLGEIVGVLKLDLDRFKVVNDTMGHEVGDKMLVETGKRLTDAMPPNCFLGRMGGDEFGVIVPHASHSQDVMKVAKLLLSVLSAPMKIDELELFAGASIGIGLYPLDGESVSSLMKNSDAAMYHAKEQGRNNIQFYRNELNASSLARMLLETSLRNALERDELEMFFQPQFDLATEQLVGAEALIRWQHPDRGMISPGEFIPVAEETGLIIPIGRWSLRTACRHARGWQLKGYCPIRISVNLSGLQFRRPDITRMVALEVEQSDLDHQFLELELTESIAMGDLEETHTKLNALSDLGIQLAIDDFGTGFSSLSYLKRYPIDTLKIDQSFVRNCTSDAEDAAIVRTIIGLAHSLNLRVIAEGVETERQKRFLQQHKCDEVQGYYFGRPMPVDEFETILVKGEGVEMDGQLFGIARNPFAE